MDGSSLTTVFGAGVNDWEADGFLTSSTITTRGHGDDGDRHHEGDRPSPIRCLGRLLRGQVRASVDGSGPDGVQVDRSGDPLELLDPGVVEGDLGAGHQVANRARDEDLPGLGLGHDPGADVDGDPPELVAHDLDLAHVDPGPDVDPGGTEPVDHFDGAFDGLGRLIERGEEPIAGGVDLPPTVPLQRAADDPVVGGQQLPPRPVAQFLGPLRRAHDVREEDGGQEPLLGRGPARHAR